MKNTVLLAIFFLLTSFGTIRAQKIFSINLNSGSGIPSVVVYDFIQDSRGFIWFSSNAGLARYDGFEFVSFTNALQTSLPGSNIIEDKYGRIWYQNFDGYLHYVQDEQLKVLDQNLPGEYVPFGIIGDSIFVVQKKGVDIYDLKTLKRIKTIWLDTKNVLASTVLKDSYYFVGEDVLYKISKDLKVSSTNYFKDNGIKVNRINNDGENLYLIYKNNEQHTLHFVNTDLKYKKKVVFPSIGSMFTDQFLDGKYWLYANTGFFVYDKDGRQVLTDKDFLLERFINKALYDKNGNLWFSGLNSGLYVISDIKNKVHDLGGYKLWDIKNDGENYILSTRDGRFIKVDKDYNFLEEYITLTNALDISRFSYNKNLDLLLAATSAGFRVVRNKKVIQFADVAVKDFHQLDDKYYAIAASGHVMLYKLPFVGDEYKSKWDELFQKNKSLEYENFATLMYNVRAKAVSGFESDDQFVILSNAGMFLFDLNGYREIKVEGKSFFASNLFNYNKKMYLLDNNGNLHVVYRSGKRALLNPELGIPNNGIIFIRRFNNILYIVCQNRIFEYDLTYSTTKVFSINTNMMRVSDVTLNNDNIVIVAFDKIITLGVNQGKLQKSIPDFYLNNFYVQSEQVQLKDLADLKYDEKSVRITFSILDYGSNIEPTISYRINKDDWIKIAAGSREIQLVALSPGEYKIEFKINNTVLKEKVFVKINYPFYFQWWFILVVSFLLIAVVGGLIYYRTIRFKRKIRNLNEKIVLENQLRTSMLTSIKAQMNPHFFYNALNTIQSFIFSNDKYQATTYLAKFSKLTRMILEMSGEPTIKLEDELVSLKLYLELEQMRFQKDFTYEVHIDDTIDKQSTQIPAMLIQPYVENAVKHGLLHKVGAKEVRLNFIDRGEMIEVVIDDNGVGRKRSEEINAQKFDKPKSFSTKSNQLRLDLLNNNKNMVSVQFEDKYNEFGQSLGTKVTLFISKNYHGN